MPGQHPQDPAPCVLMKEAVEAFRDHGQKRCQAVDHGEREIRVGRGQLPDHSARPRGDEAVGQRREFRGGERSGDADHPVQLARQDHRRDQLLAVHCRPSKRRETLDDEGDGDRIALPPDRFARPDAVQACRRGQCLHGRGA